MILLDANLLIYGYVESSSQHPRASAWLNEQFNSRIRIGVPWPSLLAFLRVTTNPRAFRQPISVASAWQAVETWLGHRNVWTPVPTERHQHIFGELLQHTGAGANLVQDAHLAALAIEHGLALCSADGDFARFPGLKWLNPLRAG